MLRIRFARMGRKNAPTYRLVVSERTKDTFGDSKEIVGFYNPRSKEISLKDDRIKHWISVGAQPSKSVHNLLITNGVITEKKKSKSKLTKRRKGKLEEKIVADKEAAEAKKVADAEAKVKAEEEAKAKAEAEKKAAEEAKEAAKAEAPKVEEPKEEKAAEETPAETPSEEPKA